MKIGVFYYPTEDGPGPLWVAREAESRGFESIFFPEHTHFPTQGQGLKDNQGKDLDDVYLRLFDPLITMGAVAAATSRIRLGTAVCLVALRDPIVTAKAVSTLDHLSKGRVEFGAGIGWHRGEIENHGVDWASRRRRFEESLGAIQRMWTADPAEFYGEQLSIRELRQFPKPMQSPHPPIHIGGESTAAMEGAIRFGGWLPTHRGGNITSRIERMARLAEDSAAVRPTVSMLVPHELLKPEEAQGWGLDRLIVRLPFTNEKAVVDALDGIMESL